MSHYVVHAPFGTDKRSIRSIWIKGFRIKRRSMLPWWRVWTKSGRFDGLCRSKGIADHTVIIFMSDNGGYTIGRADKNAPLSEEKVP